MGGAGPFIHPAGDLLGRLARRVVLEIRPNRGDRDDAGDCFQTAYLAGLAARRSAGRKRQPISHRILMMAMRQAVYRMLRKGKGAILEADFTTR